jgi:hypothetical protein
VLYGVLSGFVVAKTASGYTALDKVPIWGAVLFVGLPVVLLAAAAFLISVRAGDSKKMRAGRGLWIVLKAAGAVTALGALVALWMAPSAELCGRVAGALCGRPGPCTGWLAWLTTAGKVVLTAGAVLTAPFTRAGTWLRRKL